MSSVDPLKINAYHAARCIPISNITIQGEVLGDAGIDRYATWQEATATSARLLTLQQVRNKKIVRVATQSLPVIID